MGGRLGYSLCLMELRFRLKTASISYLILKEGFTAYESEETAWGGRAAPNVILRSLSLSVHFPLGGVSSVVINLVCMLIFVKHKALFPDVYEPQRLFGTHL